MSVVPPDAEPVSQHELDVCKIIHFRWHSRNRQKRAWLIAHRDRLKLLETNPLITPEVLEVVKAHF